MPRCACASEVYGIVFLCVCVQGGRRQGGEVAVPWHSRSNECSSWRCAYNASQHVLLHSKSIRVSEEDSIRVSEEDNYTLR